MVGPTSFSPPERKFNISVRYIGKSSPIRKNENVSSLQQSVDGRNPTRIKVGIVGIVSSASWPFYIKHFNVNHWKSWLRKHVKNVKLFGWPRKTGYTIANLKKTQDHLFHSIRRQSFSIHSSFPSTSSKIQQHHHHLDVSWMAWHGSLRWGSVSDSDWEGYRKNLIHHWKLLVATTNNEKTIKKIYITPLNCNI